MKRLTRTDSANTLLTCTGASPFESSSVFGNTGSCREYKDNNSNVDLKNRRNSELRAYYDKLLGRQTKVTSSDSTWQVTSKCSWAQPNLPPGIQQDCIIKRPKRGRISKTQRRNSVQPNVVEVLKTTSEDSLKSWAPKLLDLAEIAQAQEQAALTIKKNYIEPTYHIRTLQQEGLIKRPKRGRMRQAPAPIDFEALAKARDTFLKNKVETIEFSSKEKMNISFLVN